MHGSVQRLALPVARLTDRRWLVIAASVLAAIMLLVSAHLVGAASFQLSGRVADQSGTGIVGATVEVLNPSTGTVVASTVTSSTGNYALSVGSGTYDVRVTPPAGSGFQQTLALNQSITGITILDFTLLLSIQ